MNVVNSVIDTLKIKLLVIVYSTRTKFTLFP